MRRAVALEITDLEVDTWLASSAVKAQPSLARVSPDHGLGACVEWGVKPPPQVQWPVWRGLAATRARPGVQRRTACVLGINGEFARRLSRQQVDPMRGMFDPHARHHKHMTGVQKNSSAVLAVIQAPSYACVSFLWTPHVFWVWIPCTAG